MKNIEERLAKLKSEMQALVTEYQNSPDFRQPLKVDPSYYNHLAQLMDQLDACLYVGDATTDQAQRWALEGMVQRWMRKLIKDTTWESTKNKTNTQKKKEQRRTALKFIALAVDAAQEVGVAEFNTI